MTKEMQIAILEQRYNKISARPGAFKSPGVMRKIARQIRNLKNEN